MRIIVLAIALGLCGCHGLAPGDMKAVQPVSDTPRAGNAYVVRGWIGVFSTGMDDLAAKLNQAGVRAHVYQEAQDSALARTIIERYKDANPAEPLVLIGHSYGADDVVRIARRLDAAGVTVDLLVTLDPTTPPRVPGNVRLCYNYYQPQPFDAIPLFRGIALKADEGAKVHLINYNLRGDRKDLLNADTNHINIDKNPKVHDDVVARVLLACPPKDAWTARGKRLPATAAAEAPAPPLPRAGPQP
jgi:pimeloyl-ACP methyl ester carboxylesterase